MHYVLNQMRNQMFNLIHSSYISQSEMKHDFVAEDDQV